MEHLRRGFLIFSLLLNLVFISTAVIVVKTHWLDLPLTAFIVNKNCDQGLGNLIQLPDSAIVDQLTAKFCQSRPPLQNPLKP